MLQVIEGAEEGEDSLLQRIKKEPTEVEEGYHDSSTLQIRVSASVPRQREDDPPPDRVSRWLFVDS